MPYIPEVGPHENLTIKADQDMPDIGVNNGTITFDFTDVDKAPEKAPANPHQKEMGAETVLQGVVLQNTGTVITHYADGTSTAYTGSGPFVSPDNSQKQASSAPGINAEAQTTISQPAAVHAESLPQHEQPVSMDALKEFVRLVTAADFGIEPTPVVTQTAGEMARDKIAKVETARTQQLDAINTNVAAGLDLCGRESYGAALTAYTDATLALEQASQLTLQEKKEHSLAIKNGLTAIAAQSQDSVASKLARNALAVFFSDKNPAGSQGQFQNSISVIDRILALQP